MYRVFNEYFEQEFNSYFEAVNYARLNACAVYDIEAGKILEDYREED